MVSSLESRAGFTHEMGALFPFHAILLSARGAGRGFGRCKLRPASQPPRLSPVAGTIRLRRAIGAVGRMSLIAAISLIVGALRITGGGAVTRILTRRIVIWC